MNDSAKCPSELRGALASETDEEGRSATEHLLEERERDERNAEEKYGPSERDG